MRAGLVVAAILTIMPHGDRGCPSSDGSKIIGIYRYRVLGLDNGDALGDGAVHIARESDSAPYRSYVDLIWKLLTGA